MRTATSLLILLTSFTLAHSQTATPAADSNDRPSPLSPPQHCKPWEPMWGFWKAGAMSWPQMHWFWVDKVKDAKGDLDILFLGDSMTAGWTHEGKDIFAKEYAPLKALAIGMGGDTTRQTLWRLDNKAMEGVEPKIIVLMIGVNNIFTNVDSDDEIKTGIEAVISKIRKLSPKSKILLLSVLPMAGTRDPLNERVKSVNAKLEKLAGDNVIFFDLYSNFVDENGKAIAELYRPDNVHLAEAGYEKWNETMKPKLVELLK